MCIPHGACNAPTVTVEANTEAATCCIAAETAHMHPFEPAAISHEKKVKPFLTSVIANSPGHSGRGKDAPDAVRISRCLHIFSSFFALHCGGICTLTIFLRICLFLRCTTYTEVVIAHTAPVTAPTEAITAHLARAHPT